MVEIIKIDAKSKEFYIVDILVDDEKIRITIDKEENCDLFKDIKNIKKKIFEDYDKEKN